MATVKITVPADQTPGEEQQLVAAVATAVAASTGTATVRFELERSEDLDYRAVSHRVVATSRWQG